MSLRDRMSWKVLFMAKLVFSIVPLSYICRKKLGLFVHGRMDNADYALNIFNRHFQRSGIRKGTPMTVLELGPGDSLLTAIIAKAYGAEASILVDTGHYASYDPVIISHLLAKLNDISGIAHLGKNISTETDYLATCNCTYLTGGLESLRAIPSESVDYLFSNSVLQHVRKEELQDVLAHLRRIIRPAGVVSHRIDLRDMLASSLNHLRFTSDVWESWYMRRAPFYTNRIRYPGLMNAFEHAGFKAKVVHIDRWENLPVPINEMAEEFRSISEDELLISGFDVLLFPS